MSPGVLRVQKRVILSRLNQLLIAHAALFFQRLAGVEQSEGFFVMLYRIRCTSYSISPPVVQSSLICRSVLGILFDQIIQLLQRNHMQRHFRAVALIKRIDRCNDCRVYRSVIGEYAAYAGDIKVILIAGGLIFLNALREVCMQSLHLLLIQRCACVRADVLGEYDSEGISEVIVLTVPYQKPASLIVLPEIRFLVLIQRIHTVMCMDVCK